jgi:hypothetical protein
MTVQKWGRQIGRQNLRVKAAILYDLPYLLGGNVLRVVHNYCALHYQANRNTAYTFDTLEACFDSRSAGAASALKMAISTLEKQEPSEKNTHVMPPTFSVVVAMCAVVGVMSDVLRPASSLEGTLMYGGAIFESLRGNR